MADVSKFEGPIPKKELATTTTVEDYEYVTQFFGFTPVSLIDGIYNAVNVYIKEFFKEVGKVLEEELAKDDPISSFKIQDGCKDLIKKCYQNVDKGIDRMEMFLIKNVLSIPSDILLPEDEVHGRYKDGKNDQNETSLDEEIHQLRHDILEEVRFRQLFLKEKNKLGIILGELKRLERWFDQINDALNKNGIKEALNLVSMTRSKVTKLLENESS